MASMQQKMVSTAGAAVAMEEPAVSGQRRFLEALAESLRRRRVRYCVLHDWEGLPERLGSDLDMAVHPEDLPALGRALGDLRALGFRFVQSLEYAPDAHYLVFLRTAGETEAARVDVITAHWRKGVLVDTGEAMTARARTHRGFRVPEPAMEFRYLAAKRVLKEAAPGAKGRRLAELARQLGPAAAREAVADLFGGAADAVAEAAAGGTLDEQARELRRKLLWRNALRRPWRTVCFWGRDAARRLKRWLEPAGLMVAVAGPDGVGKSTFLEELAGGIAPAFRRVYRYHWRPGLLGRLRAGASPVNPHGAGLDPGWLSVIRLVWVALDYQMGRLQLRWRKARSGLIVFDRYYHDILVDPERYRYGGPAWLARLLARTAPKPDLLLVLDAPEEVIRGRKQELDAAELKRQLEGYRRLAAEFGGKLVDAGADAETVAAGGIRCVAGVLERQCRQRCPEWARTEGSRANA